LSHQIKALDICLDSESINSVPPSSKEIVDRLLLYHNSKNIYYNFLRSVHNSSSNLVSTVSETQYPATDDDQQLVYTIARNALKKPKLSDGEKSFLLFICNHSGLSQSHKVINTGHDIKDKVFVTENEDFLGRRFSFDRSLSLESFFPGIRLVNLKDCLDIMDLFAKTHDLYFRSPNTNATMTKGYWYWIYFRYKIPHYNVTPPVSPSLTTQNDILHAFAKRFCYLLIAIDELGKLHYFKSEDEVMMLYHFNYIISLITGIFDNLAIHTYQKYKIRFPSDNIPSRISLNYKVGKEFLDEVQKANINLRDHIRSHNDFVNLIYRLRERVIHAEGLKEIGFFTDFNMSSIILIDSDIDGSIRTCGDRPGPYRKISEWGVYKYVIPETNKNYYYLNPYYFAKSATRRLIQFADEYLKLVGHGKFLDNLNANDTFFQEINAFQQYSLRGIE
jgi:hypothetical protein